MEVLDDTIDFDAYVQEPDESANVKPASSFLDEVIDRFHNPQTHTGARLPWGRYEFSIRFRPGEVTLWLGMNGHGKALCVDTEIPTPTGWSRMGDLSVGDVVFDEAGNPCKVIAATEVMTGRPCYRLTFSDGHQIIADENHEWLTH